ncbi:MAG: helicase HerA-like domain-containing protein [Desulfovibrio sp.]
MSNGPDRLVVASGNGTELGILPGMANRHGLIAGATGTGKTVTLRVLAEAFSDLGVPVFMADVKGDLASMAEPGGDHPKVAERVAQLGLNDFAYAGYPVTFWDVFGELGHPLRTTISELGPLLLTRLLALNETQAGVLQLAFRIADDEGLLLLDLKDLRLLLRHVGDNAKEYQLEYGNVSAASVGAIQRRLLELEEQGADRLIGEPALNLDDLLQTDRDGRGMINILAAERLMRSPRVYATMLLWLLSELFENLPEVGDPEQPKLVFFFDEAHLLFDDMPEALLDKIELVVRLIRSKGVGVFFVTQNPLDVPDKVLGQLGNRVQHALRAFTPRDQRAVKAAAETFRVNPELNVEQVLTELGTGEALVSFLERKGAPGMVRRAFVYPPKSRLGTLDRRSREAIIKESVFYGHYEQEVDRESAYEILTERRNQDAEQAKELAARREREKAERAARPRPSNRQSLTEAFISSAARSIGSALGRKLLRGVLGGLLR